jgi:acetyl-CoA carboxylase carboxyltransferase component
MYGKDDVAAGGMVAGIGVVAGVKCVIVANDATVSGTSFILACSHIMSQTSTSICRQHSSSSSVANERACHDHYMSLCCDKC